MWLFDVTVVQLFASAFSHLVVAFLHFTWAVPFPSFISETLQPLVWQG